jgi:hypothetical protein
MKSSARYVILDVVSQLSLPRSEPSVRDLSPGRWLRERALGVLQHGWELALCQCRWALEGLDERILSGTRMDERQANRVGQEVSVKCNGRPFRNGPAPFRRSYRGR